MNRARLSLSLLAVAAVLMGTSLPVQAQAGGDIPLSEWNPLPPASKVVVSDEAKALRRKLLGPHALDPDYVTLAWTGVSSFVVTIKGHLLLFDAWEIVGLHADYLPIGREELAGLEPEAILIGHGHFDHAADVGYVAGLTGAAVVGSTEICQRVREDAAYDGVAGQFPCAITGTATTPEPGTMRELKLFADLDPVTILQHVHSASRQPGDGNEPNPFLPIFDPEPYVNNPNVSPAEYARFLRSLDAPQGGTWLYHFRLGNFTLLLGDSAGPIYEHPKVARALQQFPDCVDVMANAILGFNQPVSGLKDPVLYLDNVAPAVFVPTHADAWVPGLSAGQDAYIDQFEAEMRARLDHIPALDWMVDPEDYLAERAYRVDDPRWRTPPPGSVCAAGAGGGTGNDDGSEDGDAGVDDADDSLDGGPSLPATGGMPALPGAAVLAAALLTLRARRRARRDGRSL